MLSEQDKCIAKREPISANMGSEVREAAEQGRDPNRRKHLFIDVKRPCSKKRTYIP